MIAFSFSETFPFRIDIIIHHKERKINHFLVILSKIGALHKLEYLFLWKYFKKQVAFCRKRFLCCATVSICCAVFTANRGTIHLYFSRLYPHVGEGFIPPGAFAAITRFIFLWSCRGRIYAARACTVIGRSRESRGPGMPDAKAAHRSHSALLPHYTIP